MNRPRRSSPAPLAGALALALWLLCALFAQRLGAYAPGPCVLWPEGGGISPAGLLRSERYAREDGAGQAPATLLWQEEPGTARRPEGGPARPVTLIRAVGDPALLLPVGFLAGGWPARGDTSGCAVSQAAAMALWGGTGVVGQTLDGARGRYTVRGVFPGKEPLVVVQESPGSGARFSRLLFSLPGGGTPEEAEAWLDRGGLPRGTTVDLPLLAWGLGALAALPALVLTLGLLGRLGGRLWALRTAPLLLGQALIPALLLAGAALWAAGFPWPVPARLLPGRWSDFAFWAGLAGAWADALGAWLSRPLTSWDLAVWGAGLACSLLAPLAAALAGFWALRARAPTAGALWAGAAGHLLVLFALTLALRPLGGAAPGRAMWLLGVLWLAADRALTLHQTTLRPAGERRPAHEAALPPKR